MKSKQTVKINTETRVQCRIMFLLRNNLRGDIYTVNHKKRDILFLTITLADLSRFL